MIYHLSVKDGIVKFMNQNKRYVSLFNSTAFDSLFYAAANLGKTSVKFRHTLSLTRGERGVKLRIGRGKTLVYE